MFADPSRGFATIPPVGALWTVFVGPNRGFALPRSPAGSSNALMGRGQLEPQIFQPISKYLTNWSYGSIFVAFALWKEMWARLLLYIFSFISNIKNLIQFSMFVLIFSNSWFRMHKTTYRKFREKVGPWIPIGMSSNNKNIQLDEILLTWLYCVTGNVPYRHAALACGMKRFVCRFYCNLIVHDYQF